MERFERNNFHLRYQQLRKPVAICGSHYLAFATLVPFLRPRRYVKVCSGQQQEACDVDIALKLNVLAVFAVFAFVGAILLGAF
jgi:hypothetical protein